MRSGDTSLGGPQKTFPQTIHALVSGFRASPSAEQRAVLDEFFASYWKPVYTYIRSAWAKTNDDAKDSTQAFFAWLLESEAVKGFEPERGSFRTYLKSLLKHFMQHREEALSRLKRGGGVRWLNIHDDAAPLSDVLADPRSVDPEKAFDELWVKAVTRQAVTRVRGRLTSAGRSVQLRVFEEYDLSPAPERPTYAAVAAKLGIKETDVRNYLFAVREEIRSEIRAELSRLTSDEQGLEEEWNALFGA